MKKYFYLMRHGETLFNVRKKIQGACDSPLTFLGIEQAKIASKYFNNISFIFNNCIINNVYTILAKSFNFYHRLDTLSIFNI